MGRQLVEEGSLDVGPVGHHGRPLGRVSLDVLDGRPLALLASAADGVHELALLVRCQAGGLVARQCHARSADELMRQVLDREQDRARAACGHAPEQVLARDADAAQDGVATRRESPPTCLGRWDQRVGDRAVEGGQRVVGISQDEQPLRAKQHQIVRVGQHRDNRQPYACSACRAICAWSSDSGALLTMSWMSGTWSSLATRAVMPVPS